MFNRIRKAKQQQPENTRADFEQLVQRAIDGDSKALSQLCEEIAKGVLFQMTHILGNQANVEDVSQEVLIRVCENIRNLRSPKAFKVWLGRIIINEKNRYLAKNSRRGIVLNIDDYLENIVEEKTSFLPQEYAECDELRATVMEVISRLPMRQREAVMLHYYDGMSVTEVAEAMDITTQSVSKNLSLAREKLRRELQEQPFASDYVDTMGVLPIGALMASALRQEGAQFALTHQAYLQAAMAKCGEYVLGEGAVAAAYAQTSAGASTSSSSGGFGYAMCAVGVAIAAVAVIVGISLGAQPEPQPTPWIGDAAGVIFAGGIDSGEAYVHLNPEHAQIYIQGQSVELTPLNWWITPAGSDAALHEGYGGDASSALAYLREMGLDGEYMLFFLAQEENGALHKIGSNFYIFGNFYE